MPIPPEGWEPPSPHLAGRLTPETLAGLRAQLPLVYVDAVPVRVDDSGDVVAVGLLLRMGPRGLTRSLVSGRVLYHERIRDALLRHLEKDLGPVTGDCRPRQDALDIAWLTPEEACSDAVQAEFINGQGMLLRQAMAWVGRLV